MMAIQAGDLTSFRTVGLRIGWGAVKNGVECSARNLVCVNRKGESRDGKV